MTLRANQKNVLSNVKNKGARKCVFLVFGGVDLFSQETVVSSTMRELQRKTIDHGNQNKLTIVSKSFNTRADGAVILEGAKYLKPEYKPGDRAIIYGYSMGGVAANQVAKFANSYGIQVDLLVTVDAAWGVFGRRLEVSKNVVTHVNFYQTFPSKIGSRGYEAVKIEEKAKTHIINDNWNGRTSEKYLDAHGVMDEDTLEEALNYIKAELCRGN